MSTRICRLFRLVAALVVVSNAVGMAYAEPLNPVGPETTAKVPVSQFIVRLSGKVDDAVATSAVSRVAAMSAAVGQPLTFSHIGGLGALIVRSSAPLPSAQAYALARRIAQLPGVASAEVDERFFPQMVPNDPNYSSQWALQPATATSYGIDAQTAWDTSTGVGAGGPVYVAVLDTGIVAHADLSGQYVGGYDFISNALQANDGDGRDSNPADTGDWVTPADSSGPGPFQGCPVVDSSWHGTFVAGLIAARTHTNPPLGVAGAAFGAKVVPIRVLGKCGGSASDLADAIVWAAGGAVSGVPANPYPAKIINVSAGGAGLCSPTVRDAIATARNGYGALVVVAAGDTTGGVAAYWPANCPGVLAVTATAKDGTRAWYSNFGRPAALSAPGGDVYSDGGVMSTANSGTTSPNTSPGGDTYPFKQGTSVAAPLVSAVAALMLAKQPNLTAAQLAAMLRGTATPYRTLSAPGDWPLDCEAQKCGDGITNAAAAVAAANACTSVPTGVPASIDTACNGDYDGNGVVDPLTDGLIAFRLAMGFTGTAVTNGALGNCATRTTYAQLRAWSNRNCGTSYSP